MLRVLAALCLGLAGCTEPCTSTNYRGCCVENVCYEGGCKDAGVPCTPESYSCATVPCCAKGFWGDPLTCNANKACVLACKEDGPCSSNAECCSGSRVGAAYTCDLSKNACSLCWTKGHECVAGSSNSCCPGLTCSSKPATPNYHECL